MCRRIKFTFFVFGFVITALVGVSEAVLGDNFESYSLGPVDTVTMNWRGTENTVIGLDPANAANQVLVLTEVSSGQQGIYCILSNIIGATIDEGATKTLFLRFRVNNSSIDQTVGLTDVDSPPLGGTGGWGDFRAQFRVTNGNLDVRDGGSFVTLVPDINTGETEPWYNLWMVVNNGNDTVKLYLHQNSLANATEADILTYNSKDTFEFRVDTTNALDRIYWRGQSTSSSGLTLWLDDIYIMDGESLSNPNREPNKAYNPNPDNGATDVPCDVILRWAPGSIFNKHNVYFGTDSDEIQNADAGSQLLVSPAQDANLYDPGILEFSQTYFWRVDEVNDLSDSKIYKGDIWSFTVEPYAATIPGENITATASSQTEGQGPEQTINNSGLDANDLHSTVLENMWITAEGETGPAWIQYEFDKIYKLHEMLVWNYNGGSILSIFGVKDVTIEYSTDGTDWMQLSGISEFNSAPGANNYAANTVVPFEGAAAKYVKINTGSNWSAGLYNQIGLSEVRFTVIPVSARESDPESGATDIAVDTTLSWRAGREAQEHKVYISTDQQSVIDGTALVDTVSSANYGPLSLDLGSNYYWRIDEVNNTQAVPVWQGDIWNFTTQKFLIVDDFESYNEIISGQQGSNLVYETWTDGYDNSSVNGSAIGYTEAFQPSMETDIIHGGSQSVPLLYDNGTASYSEVTVSTDELAVGRDWTRGDVKVMTLWFYGDPNNAVTEQLYVKLNGAKVLYDGDNTDIAISRWSQWNINLESLGLDLSNVTTLTIGLERIGAVGGSGTILFDDIRLYKTPPPEIDALVAHYGFEFNAEDDSDNGYHGTINGNPTYVQSLTGYGTGLQFDGVDDFVEVPDNPAITFAASDSYTIAAWVYVPDISGTWRGIAFKGRESGGSANYYGICIGSNGGVATWYYGAWPTWGSAIPEPGWYHAAVVQNGPAGTKQLYINGALDSETTAQAADAAGSLVIGASLQTGEFFNGIVDDLWLYNIALSEAEVLFLAGK